METFELDVSFAVDLQRVLRAFWDLEDWPSLTTHVRKIEMHYCDENVQVLTMHVVTNGHHDRFKSVRMKQGNGIYYLQPDPPPILRRHNGSWQFNAGPGSTIVTSRHFVDINTDVAAAFVRKAGLPVGDRTTTHQQIKNIICNNSLQTMLALKKRFEGEIGGLHVSRESYVMATT